MELWKIYDKDGNYTGMKVDKDDKRAWEENAFHQGVDAWIINSDNKILIQKRAPFKKWEPNMWSMTVGGSVINDENILEALQRESVEELGIKLNMESAKKIKRYRLSNLWLDVYLVKQDVDIKDIKLRENEVSDIKFATYDEIEKIYKDNMFMRNRWEFVRDEIKELIESKSE